MSHSESGGFVVLIDDDLEMRNMTADFLKTEGYSVAAYSLATEFLAALRADDLQGQTSADIDLLITDLNMPEMDGLELMDYCRQLLPQTPVILITAFGSIDTAIEATKKGAYDYLVKPFKLKEIAVVIHRAVNFCRLRKENEILRSAVKRDWAHGNMIGNSRSMREIFQLIERIAKASANVLITGESGTGKELVARAIHEQGPRKSKAFVAVNCTSIPDALLESELFGHAKGAFTGAVAQRRGLFEEADGGTLFLDEIGDLDLNLQAKLLRAIQEKKIKRVGENEYRDIDVRIICATHKDLRKSISEGSFREDLFYRLSVIPVEVPSLRQRKEDIPLLANYFLQKYAALNNPNVKGFAPEAMDRLMRARWDGNVRELENVVERVVVLANKSLISAQEIPTIDDNSVNDLVSRAGVDWPSLDQLEKKYIEMVLAKTGGRKERAAQILGINRRTLYRKEREFGWVTEEAVEFEAQAEAL